MKHEVRSKSVGTKVSEASEGRWLIAYLVGKGGRAIEPDGFVLNRQKRAQSEERASEAWIDRRTCMNHFLLRNVRSSCGHLDIVARGFRGSLRTIPLAVISLALVALSYACPAAAAQANEWTWLGGSTSLANGGILGGVYGTVGTPSPANNPGSRASAATWTDKSGNLWLFSGEVYEEYYNDLWMFNSSTAEWIWMGGSNVDMPGATGGVAGVYGSLGTPSVGNTPGGRQGAVTWSSWSPPGLHRGPSENLDIPAFLREGTL